jgi:hypothetical protein
VTAEDRPKTMAEALEERINRPRDPQRDKRHALLLAANALRDFPEDPKALRFAAYASEHATVAEIVEATGLPRAVVEEQIAAWRGRLQRYERDRLAGLGALG